MVPVLVDSHYNKTTTNELPSKLNFDSVVTRNDKPTVGTVGLLRKSDIGVSDNGYLNTPIIADAPNLYKQIGAYMSEEGFIKLPRSLLNDPQWKSLRLKYQKVFITLLTHTSFSQRTFSINTNLVTIAPGQFCTSIRALVDLCNDGISFKEDKVDKNIVERAVSLFFKIGIVRHEVRHRKCIFTITQPELYAHFQNQGETQSETRPRHNRDTNEERKEREDVKETIDRAEALDSFLLNLEIEESQEKQPSAFEAPVQPKLDDQRKKHFELLWEFISKNGMVHGSTPNRLPGIKEKDLENWVKKHEAKEIMECLKMTLKAVPSKTWPGYVNMLLKNRISKKEEDSIKGRRIVEGVVKNNNMKHIEMKKDYFKDLISDEQSYYHLPSDTLNAILKRSFERQKEREGEEKRHQDEEDKYY